MTIAFTRAIADSIVDCELTHLARAPIDVARARAQHAAYVDALRAAGCTIVGVDADPAFPDCVFIEDTAVIVDGLAVLTRPGAESRRGEVDAVAAALSRHVPLARIEAPATLDGGDVLVVGEDVYVGRTARTNDAGIDALARLLGGKRVQGVDVTGCLHLKTAATHLGGGALLVNPAFVNPSAFSLGRRAFIESDPAEPAAANALRVGGVLLYPREHPQTAARLRAAGYAVVDVENSELAKAEGGVTCCSLLLD